MRGHCCLSVGPGYRPYTRTWRRPAINYLTWLDLTINALSLTRKNIGQISFNCSQPNDTACCVSPKSSKCNISINANVSIAFKFYTEVKYLNLHNKNCQWLYRLTPKLHSLTSLLFIPQIFKMQYLHLFISKVMDCFQILIYTEVKYLKLHKKCQWLD